MTAFLVSGGLLLGFICTMVGVVTYIGVSMGYQTTEPQRLSAGGRFGLAVAYLLMIIGLALLLGVGGWSVMGGGQ